MIQSEMTQCETSMTQIIPGFSTLRMKQEQQDRVRRDTEGMTDAEIREHIANGAAEFWADIDRIRAEKTKISF